MHALRAQLAPLNAELEQALDDLHVALCLCDIGGVVRWINPEMAALVGEVVGRHFNALVAPESRGISAREFARKQTGASTASTYDLTLVGSAGHRIPVRVRSVAVRADRDVVGAFAAVIPKVDLRELLREPHRPAPVLTRRQADVLSALAKGLTTREMATRLGISTETVRNHIRTLLRELGVHSRVAAVAAARRRGLL